jgi:chorismate mutase
MMMRGVRGATTVEENTDAAITSATSELLQAIIEANDIKEEDVASVIFSATPDLNASFPARAAREMGWHQTALMGCQEMDVPNGVPKCIRILLHWNTTKGLSEIKHVFMNRAAALRPDLIEQAETSVNGRVEQ